MNFTNALDPVGIKNIRELILSINEENTTFIISSHNLAELENICNKYIIMHKGKIIRFEVMDSKKSNQFLFLNLKLKTLILHVNISIVRILILQNMGIIKFTNIE